MTDSRRTPGQAESLKQLLDREKLALTAVVNYELPTSEIVARLSGRRTGEKCKAVFQVTQLLPGSEGRCDRCDGKRFQREDDRPESIQVRRETYDRSTAPLIEFYRKAGLLLRGGGRGIARRDFRNYAYGSEVTPGRAVDSLTGSN